MKTNEDSVWFRLGSEWRNAVRSGLGRRLKCAAEGKEAKRSHSPSNRRMTEPSLRSVHNDMSYMC